MKPSVGSRFPFSPAAIIGIIAGVTLIRTFLENFSNPEPIGGFTSIFLIINYFLFYSVVVLSLGIFIGIITKQSWLKTISLVTLGLPIIWIAPIVDLLVSGGACMSYISSTGVTLVKDIFIIFRPLTQCGATIGIRIEIIFIVIALARYVFKKNQSIFSAVTAGVMSYLIIWVHSAIPGIVQTIAGSTDNNFFRALFSNSLLGSIHSFSFALGGERFVEQIALFMGRVPWLISMGLLAAITYREYRSQMMTWLRNAQFTRILYYLLLGISGIVIATKTLNGAIAYTIPDLFAYAIFFISIIINGWLAITINDTSDISIDQISNPDRPLIQKAFTVGDMHQLGILFSALLVTGGLLLNWNVFILLLVAQICYVAYSTHPLRLKRHYLSSSFLVACAGLATLLAGYFLIAPNQTFTALPGGLLFVIFITLAIFSNTKDFKDVAGDRACEIKTMPVVFGTRKAGVILSVVIIAWILLVSLIYQNLLIASFIAPIIIIDVIIRKRIPEYVRFLIIFIEIILLLIVL